MFVLSQMASKAFLCVQIVKITEKLSCGNFYKITAAVYFADFKTNEKRRRGK